MFMGLGPCTINGVAFPVCTTNGNLQQRRVLSLVEREPEVRGADRHPRRVHE